MPEIVTALQAKLPDQLEDLESGCRKLFESDTTSPETDIESRFQQLHASLKVLWQCIRPELDNAIYEMNKFKKKSMHCITSLLVKLNHKKL